MSKKQKSFADALKAARAKSGLSQSQLAERAGLGKATITQIEQGLRMVPAGDTLLRLARALDTTAEELGGCLIA